jgi:site-specific recombinase XerD
MKYIDQGALKLARKVESMLEHEKASTTQIYAQLREERRREL